MKILLSHRFFWPDTAPYATMLRSLARRLVLEGHDVTVFTTHPSYHASEGLDAPSHEIMDGFQIVRMPIFKENKKNLPLRGFNILAYAAGLRRHILKTGGYDIVIASTFPPLLAARAASIASRKIGARFIYHFMDIHPEVSLYSGQLRKGHTFKMLQRFDNKTCHHADVLVVLSQDMADSLTSRPGNQDLKPVVLNNFLLENFDNVAIQDAPSLPADKFTVLFAGNIGRFQNLDIVIKAAHKLSNQKEIQFWFMGEGAAKESLMKQAGSLLENTVFFLPFAHHSVALDMMGKASLNIVSLLPDMYKVAYPSKTLSILSQSAPILAIMEQESELARMVETEKIGYTADQTSADSVAQAIQQAYQNRKQQNNIRKSVKKLYEREFEKEKILDRWVGLISNLNKKD